VNEAAQLRFVMAGGGTGGHVLPLLAVAVGIAPARSRVPLHRHPPRSRGPACPRARLPNRVDRHRRPPARRPAADHSHSFATARQRGPLFASALPVSRRRRIQPGRLCRCASPARRHPAPRPHRRDGAQCRPRPCHPPLRPLHPPGPRSVRRDPPLLPGRTCRTLRPPRSKRVFRHPLAPAGMSSGSSSPVAVAAPRPSTALPGRPSRSSRKRPST
jgi:hypothetical protein